MKIRLALLATLFFSPLADARTPPPNPDFTQGGKTDGSHDWNLGSSGASGWIYANRHTDAARQILVTQVEKGSPADGLLTPNDVILGIAGQPFQSDARIAFAQALAKAEAGGILPLLRWRDGETTTVKLNIPVLGDYTDTAPYDCPKSAKIFAAGCEAIAKRGINQVSIPDNLNALALLASGDPKYKTILADHAKRVADYQTDGFATWFYGYAMIFLAEYVLATDDQSVLPGLERLALESAIGQSTVGTWSHKFALPDGRPAGYGAMNSPGLTLTLGMALAREAGVKKPKLDEAIAKSAAFLRWYLDKGAIPYGDHTPWPGHEDNGKCSNAAVLYNLLGDAEATNFFTKMSLAAYDERERGHTGNFFNIIWAMPGVGCGGPLATAAYWQEHSWYYDLARRPDGSFRYQGSPVGEEEHKKYTHWDNTGLYLLAYALPLKSLYITGKKNNTIPAFTAPEVSEIIDAGRGYFTDKKDDPFKYDKRPTKDLLAGLTSWSPAVRKRSSSQLGKGSEDVTSLVVNMMASPDRYTRYGAAEALGQIKSDQSGTAKKAVVLMNALNNDDLWLRILAAESLTRLGDAAKPALPTLLKRFATQDIKSDPRAMEQRYLSFALFDRGGPLSRSLEGIDRELLLTATAYGLKNEDGRARSNFGRVLKGIPFEDLTPILPAIHQTIAESAPSGIMFSHGIQMDGLELFTEKKVSEGIELIVNFAHHQKKHGSQARLPILMNMLKTYGTHARRVIPALEAMAADFEDGEEGFPGNLSKGKARLVRQTIEEIKACKNTPKLIELNL